MNFVLCALKVQTWCSSIQFFHSKGLVDDSYGCPDIDFSVLSESFLGFTLGKDVKVNEGSARDWLFTTRC